MKTRSVYLICALGLLPLAAPAQTWEIGGVGGGSFYTSREVKHETAGKADAGFDPGFAAGFALTQGMGRYWGGEIRYTYLRNDATLDGNGSASFGAQSHALHYDFLLHFAPTGAKTRPYISFGAGFKFYQGTGQETITQPLSEFALLTKTSESGPVASFGFGVKFKIHDRVNLRVEIKDYLSPIPAKLIQPNIGAELSGWIHNFVPMVGVSYIF